MVTRVLSTRSAAFATLAFQISQRGEHMLDRKTTEDPRAIAQERSRELRKAANSNDNWGAALVILGLLGGALLGGMAMDAVEHGAAMVGAICGESADFSER